MQLTPEQKEILLSKGMFDKNIFAGHGQKKGAQKGKHGGKGRTGRKGKRANQTKSYGMSHEDNSPCPYDHN